MKDAVVQFEKKRVLVVGDVMLDRFTSGSTARLSPEAPVPVVSHTTDRYALGGAGNVANNIAALGARVYLCGVVGKDAERTVFISLCRQSKISNEGIIVDSARPTTLKHRLLAGAIQLTRFDREETRSLDPKIERMLIRTIKRLVPRSDIIVLSDYAKGCLTLALVRAVKAAARANKKKIVADIKPTNHARFAGVNLITPNLEEARAITGEDTVEHMGKKLVSIFRSDVFLTRGGDGISVFGKKGLREDIPSRMVTVYDVTGAGDTVTAVSALALAAGMKLSEAARLANRAGELAVQRAGTATISLPDLLSTFTTHYESAHMVEKVWGKEQWLENNDKYCCKLLFVKKGYQCSLHYHKVKDEMFLLSKGHIRLELGKKVLYLREGNFVRVPPGTLHRFRGLEDSVMVEISTHHDDADSYRVKGQESRKVHE